MARRVKNLPAMQETRVRSLGQKDPLEKGMATHSTILAWIIPWIEEPGGLKSCMNITKTRYPVAVEGIVNSNTKIMFSIMKGKSMGSQEVNTVEAT